MLKNIKSYYIVKIVFLYVYEKQKLKIVKYNKSLQKNIDISIANYKHFSGRYIIYESNRIGKEYFASNDILYFVGEYLNGERNGKGKEYWNDGSLSFEGEYLNGERNGKGKEYYNGIVVFEGEYLNSIPWKGTTFNSDGNVLNKISINFNEEIRQYSIYGNLVYEGKCLNGKRNGKGKEYYNDSKLKFEGEYLNNKKWNGKGFNSLNEVLYKLKNGKGLVKEYDYNDKLSFEGEYLNGEKNGKGKEYDPNSNLIYIKVNS